MRVRLAVIVPLVALAVTARPHLPVAGDLPRVEANDNRRAAGTLHGDTLVVRLVVGFAEWYPEADDGLHVTVQAFSEEGRAPVIPAPLLRVATGTVVAATVRNALPDSTIHLIGLATRPASDADTVSLAPGDSVSLVFPAGEPGTYLYRAVIGHHPDGRDTERETAAGAFVVDPPGGSPPDRVLVMNAWADPIDSLHMAAALAINGKSWPHTERLRPTVGDTLRWRIVNATVRAHPMHLHGFYFTANAAGDGLSSHAIASDRRMLEVTRSMRPWTTLDLVWTPDRPGNWLFHCHLTFHVVSVARLDGGKDHDAMVHSADPAKHMAGLVLGIEVAARAGGAEAEVAEAPAERFDLFINQGGAWGRIPVTYSYILQRGAEPPASDSLQLFGSTIVLTRGRATDIVVHNRAREPAAVHWHGLELGSWSDGVAGWSGSGDALAPAVAPGDSFTAHLHLPRAGTFIYHTHLNDLAQVTGGAVGALLVLEPGERHDPARDHVLLGHWHGRPAHSGERVGLLINGDSLESPPLTVEAGVPQRFRLINIGPANEIRFQLRRGGRAHGAPDTFAVWRARAKDGADLPPALRVSTPAIHRLAVGETADFDFVPEAGQSYVMEAAFGQRPAAWRRPITVPVP